jgi:two-component system, cell cycle response regulator DivK
MNQIRVLVVDDNEMFVEMATFVLNKASHLTASANGAEQAMALIPEFKPDLILMDIQMPGTDGMALTSRLKADPGTRHIPVVAFTAYAAKGDEMGLKAAGFDGYIAKPVDVETLAAQVRFWLEGPSSARNSHFLWP